ncbi:MAG TPA: type 4a pilus biogenesis protein PilO [Candidatus Paceibacterota bacterium]
MKSTSGLIMIFLGILILFFLGKPFFADVSALKDEQKKYKDAVEQISKIEETKNDLLSRLEALSPEERQKIDAFLPTRAEMVRLIASLDGVASRHGISLEEASSGQSMTDTSRSVSESDLPQSYNSKTVTLGFTASYSAMVNFLKDVEKSLRIVDIVSIDSAKAGDSGSLFQYKVSLQTYWVDSVPFGVSS